MGYKIKEEDKLISAGKLQKLLPGKIDTKFRKSMVKLALKLFGFERVNKLYDRNKQHHSADFVEAIFAELDVKVVVENPEVLERFREGPFVCVCNHPYGHLDSMSLLKTIVPLRPDYKTTANFILNLIETMQMHFIAMDPYNTGGEIKESAFDSVKDCLDHVRAGHPLGFFPAGMISFVRFGRGFRPRTQDTEWRLPTVRIIQRMKVPIIPVYFPGRNSWWFYSIGRVLGWRLRYTRLIAEIFNKRGKTVILRFGEPIMPEQIKGMKPEEAARFMYDNVYRMRR